MDNVNINLLMPNTNEIKSETKSIKTSKSSLKDNEDEFDVALKKAAPKTQKVSKSIINEKVKSIKINKSKEPLVLSDEKNKEALDETIVSLISSALQVPVEEVNKILAQIECEATDLLDQGNFKVFLNALYDGAAEGELLFNEGKLKDISKLFMQLEQISEVIQSGEGNFLVEKLVGENEVLETHVTQLSNQTNVQSAMEEVTEGVTVNGLAQGASQAHTTLPGKLREGLAEEAMLSSEMGEEGTALNFKELGLGISVPIQAFNSTMNAKMWDHSITQAQGNYNSEALPLMNQIIDKIELTSLKNSQEITMQLSPKELGNLSIKLTETNGVIVADIKVENDKAKELILSEVDKLKQTLQEQGISVGEVKVDVRQNPHQSQMEQQKQKSTKRIQELVQKHFYEEDLEEIEENQSPIETEVDYMV